MQSASSSSAAASTPWRETWAPIGTEAGIAASIGGSLCAERSRSRRSRRSPTTAPAADALGYALRGEQAARGLGVYAALKAAATLRACRSVSSSLGSTGSIGEQALDVVAGSEELELAGLSAATNWERLCAQARETGAPAVALTDAAAAASARSELDGVRVLPGDRGVRELIATSGADLVLNAIVGTAGLGPTIVALSEGIDVALANKESLVVGGELVTALAEATQARILPVDSEHSAIFQLLARRRAGSGRAADPDRVRRSVSRPRRARRRDRARRRSPTRRGRWAGGSRSTRRR